MMYYKESIVNSIKENPELKIIDSQKLYTEKFYNVPEPTFYKVFSRLTEEGEIKRIAKGIYCIPRQGRFGITTSSKKNILDFCLGENKNQGVVIGYQLFNKYGLSTQISKVVEVYSNVITQNEKTIKNFRIYKINLSLDETTIRMIEFLEILQEYKHIQDFNKKKFSVYLNETVKFYNEEAVGKVLNSMGYKKNTVASMKSVLDYHGIKNSLNQYLRGTSKYKMIDLEELYDSTSKKS